MAWRPSCPGAPQDRGVQYRARLRVGGRRREGQLRGRVNSLFLRTSDTPNTSSATFVYTENIVNDTGEDLDVGARFSIAAPEIRLRGQISDVGPGPVPAFIPEAGVSAQIVTSITRLDGSIERDVHFDYGMLARRDPATGDFAALLSRDARGFQDLGAQFDFHYVLSGVDIQFGSIAFLMPGGRLSCP